MAIQPERTRDFVNSVLERYSDMVYRLALARTKKKEDAEDVFQEVFLRLMKEEKPFFGEEHLKAWLIRVTINCSRKIFCSSWFRKTVPLDEKIPVEWSEQSETLDAVLSLPKTDRTIIYLYYKEDYSLKEIAAILHMNESTVRSRLSRARTKLREKLGGVPDEGQRQGSV